MYINKIDAVSYKAALPTSKKADFSATVKEAKKVLGINKGLSLLKISSTSMPTQKQYDSGIGKLNSESALNFLKFITFYTGVSAIKDFPAGQTTKHNLHHGFYCPYLKTAVTFGEENINLSNIIDNKEYYGFILENEDRKDFIDKNKSNPYAIYYERELGEDDNYPVLKPLKTAFENYKSGLSTASFEHDFNEYKKQDIVKNTYSRLALYPLIHEKEPDLFKNFENDLEKQKKFEQYKNLYADEIDFFNFRQFIAQKEHDDAKKSINENRIDLFGDCLIGFAPQETWAHPDAFMDNTCIGNFDWGLPALKFKEILNPDSAAHKVFDEKLSFFLKNYDGIRFDVGWCYAIAKIEEKGKDSENIDLGHKLFDFIEKRAQEIKGKDFDTHKLIYEMDGFEKMFTGWDEKKPEPIPNVKNIVNVLTTEYQNTEKVGWGSPEFYLKTGLTEDEIIVGTNNHDGANLKALAEATRPEYEKRLNDNAEILSKLFKISKQNLINSPAEFVKAKFAQLYTVKNQFLFFVDVLGSKEDIDCQNIYPGNYRFRVDENYERQYHNALQQGFGFNLPEVLGIVMKSKNLDKKYPILYSKLNSYAEYLRKIGPKTESDANIAEKTTKVCSQNK